MAFSIGISMDEFKHLNPTKLGYCLKGYEMQRKARDEEVWGYFGSYGLSAVMTAVEHCLAGRMAVSKYISVPNLRDGIKDKVLTEEEKQREVDRFFAQEAARRVNWRRSHPVKKKDDGGEVS